MRAIHSSLSLLLSNRDAIKMNAVMIVVFSSEKRKGLSKKGFSSLVGGYYNIKYLGYRMGKILCPDKNRL